MAGGGTSWLDLALYLIARLVGVEAAMQVARINLIDWHARRPAAVRAPGALAPGGRRGDRALPDMDRASTTPSRRRWRAMVRLSGLAERSFKRRFQQATGMSPLEYVHTLRLEEAKQMLETGEQPIEGIANEVGYEDAAFFSRLFRRKVELTPVQYRRRFGGLRRSLTSGTT